VTALPDAALGAILSLRSVSQRFGARVALDGLSVDVPRAQVVGLLGPNGAGKTTVINAAAGLQRPTEGTVAWEGQALPFPFPAGVRRRIGVVPQDTALYDELTATENLRFTADLFGVASPKARVGEVLELVGLADRARDRVGTLSGGMRRRLGFARALVHDPDLLVLDEPTLAVDVDNRHAIWGHVRRLRREGKTVLLSTNYLDEAEALCDVIVALGDGRVVATGAPSDLLRSAGRCVEIDCDDAEVAAVRRRLEVLDPNARVEATGAGLTVHVGADAAAETFASAALGTGAVRGVRVRAPDMVEVLESLGSGARG
jgi:ABC-2 type transport system ATP-binding protein